MNLPSVLMPGRVKKSYSEDIVEPSVNGWKSINSDRDRLKLVELKDLITTSKEFVKLFEFLNILKLNQTTITTIYDMVLKEKVMNYDKQNSWGRWYP